MTFTSITFALFLPLVFALYWSIRGKAGQNIVLVTASYVFYGWWDYRFCALLLFTSSLDYVVGLMLGSASDPSRRKLFLVSSIIANLGVLALFKYFDFFSESLRQAGHLVGVDFSPLTLKLILPVGISFYTFQSLGYTIDVYRRQIEPARNLIDFLAFVSFFPQLVAGPIERANNLLVQFVVPRHFDADLAVDGCRQMLWGAVKKMVVADNLAPIVETVYGDPSRYSGPQAGLATVCFAVQIYCDFSGYSDIALGCAKLFGVQLRRNFAYPYFSRNLREFWHRWHISLSSWFRDYVYIPLGGSRYGRRREAWNLLLTFTASALWHGASWHFVVWGLVNGMGLVVERQLTGQRATPLSSDVTGVVARGRLGDLLSMAATFVFICIGWIFFRASSTADAILVLRSLAIDSWAASSWTPAAATIIEQQWALVAAAGCLGVEWLRRGDPHPLIFAVGQDRSRGLQYGYLAFRWAVYTVLVLSVLQFAPFRGREFLYFQF